MVTDGPAFEWNVNPSTRPVVAGRDGRDAQGPPQDRLAFANPAASRRENTGDPLRGSARGGRVRRRGPAGRRQRPLHGPHRLGRPEHRLGRLRLRRGGQRRRAVGGVRRHDRGRGDVRPAGGHVHGGDRQLRPGRRRRRTTTGATAAWTFQSPRPRTETGIKEAWTFTCERPGRPERHADQVIVDRGGRADVGDACAVTAAARKR